MKTNNELRAALNMVLVRLDSDPRSAEEWATMADALAAAAAYARKCVGMRRSLEHRPCLACAREECAESGVPGIDRRQEGHTCAK